MTRGYPCAVCGTPSTTSFEGVPLCAEHDRETRTYLNHHRAKLNEMVRNTEIALREHVRTHLLDGKVP